MTDHRDPLSPRALTAGIVVGLFVSIVGGVAVYMITTRGSARLSQVTEPTEIRRNSPLPTKQPQQFQQIPPGSGHNYTDIDEFFREFKRAVGTRDNRVIAEFVSFLFDQQMNLMTKEEFTANYELGNDEVRIILHESLLRRYPEDLGYGINNAAFAMTFKRDLDGYWKWASIYYGE
jgi:hypothetical protein